MAKGKDTFLNITVQVGYRYGSGGSVKGEDIKAAINNVVSGLITEEYEKPDDEHYQAYIINGDMGLTGYVDGILKLENVENLDAPFFYTCVETAEEMEACFTQFVKGELSTTKENGWHASISDLTGIPGKDFRKYPAS